MSEHRSPEAKRSHLPQHHFPATVSSTGSNCVQFILSPPCLDDAGEEAVGHKVLVLLPVLSIFFLAHVIVSNRSVHKQDSEVDSVKIRNDAFETA